LCIFNLLNKVFIRIYISTARNISIFSYNFIYHTDLFATLSFKGGWSHCF